MAPVSKVDISENTLRNRGVVLDILLLDRSKSTPNKQHNIIWATDGYDKKFGNDCAPNKPIKREQITGANGKLIQPRAAKSREEQAARTKLKAEVFTPLKVVKEMNLALDWASKNYPATKSSWEAYIKELRLEITCGEAPFIADRYNASSTSGVVITPKHRVGFLDRKLQVIGEFTNSKIEWLKYAEVALKSCYGYEWQGDNLLIARENILLTIEDFYKDFCANVLNLKSKQTLSDNQLEYFAEIISWNIFQMDGLRYVVPMSCRHETKVVLGGNTIFGIEPDIVEKNECEGCKFNRPDKHNGKYVYIMDWRENVPRKFVDLTLNSLNI